MRYIIRVTPDVKESEGVIETSTHIQNAGTEIAQKQEQQFNRLLK
jgi:hypothetical protein